MRIVSLLPSATEIVCAVGKQADLVGVSHECDFPAAVVGTRVLTGSRVEVSGGSGSIDRDVRELLKSALAVYDIDVDALREVQPDVIVTQDLCDVCAVSLTDVERALKSLELESVRIVNLHPMELADIWADIARVGDALDASSKASIFVKESQARLSLLSERCRVARGVRPKPNVLTIEWIEPVMVGGMWMPELIAGVDGHPLVCKARQHAPTLSRSELQALDPAPDVVLIKPCGFKLERTKQESQLLTELLQAMPWPAVRNGQVWLADGNAFFNRPGPRIVESCEILAACVWPDELGDYAEKHEGAFERLF